MGYSNADITDNQQVRARFARNLLTDLQSLEQLISKGMIENDVYRIGAEQEFCLVTNEWRPASNSTKILELLADSHFQTELATYNLEVNLDPVPLGRGCFLKTEESLHKYLDKAAKVASSLDTGIVLTGILPTVSKRELAMQYMTPQPRYYALNDAIRNQRGHDIQLHITGVDELTIKHDSVLFEACNTSFQLHLQVPADDFISSYNWAQAISAPVLGVSANSPLLLGRELWKETRIALFQQSIDTRLSSFALKEQDPRVSFGEDWENSVAGIFRNDIARHRILLAREVEEDSYEQLLRGELPLLRALCLHNGTIYRWNRPCYGAYKGKAHVRIENRYIPAGPTVLDEVANFAFWTGLMMGRPPQFEDMPGCMDFRDAKANFYAAARTGMDTVIQWNGKPWHLRELILQELLPIAGKGLDNSGISPREISRYLGVIEKRVQGSGGAQWLVSNFRRLRKEMSRDESLVQLTRQMVENAASGLPVHEWKASFPPKSLRRKDLTVGQVMSSRLFVVREGDLSMLAIAMMKWHDIHHVPVENDHGELCGILTWTHIEHKQPETEDTIVGNLMERNVITTTTDVSFTEAISVMKSYEIGCLPVTSETGKELVGIITIRDVKQFDHA